MFRESYEFLCEPCCYFLYHQYIHTLDKRRETLSFAKTKHAIGVTLLSPFVVIPTCVYNIVYFKELVVYVASKAVFSHQRFDGSHSVFGSEVKWALLPILWPAMNRAKKLAICHDRPKACFPDVKF